MDTFYYIIKILEAMEKQGKYNKAITVRELKLIIEKAEELRDDAEFTYDRIGDYYDLQ